MGHVLLSAAHKSSGKTTISLGLCAALRSQGHVIQPFKKGPDYIDPMWLAQAAGRACYNLDFYTMGREEILQTFARQMQGADIGLIEGNKGLYDGLDLDGSNSNAALSTLLKAPVILVLDARGMTRGIAPLVLGYQAFDRDVNIAGVILNKVGGSRHESKLRSILEHYTDVRVLGAVHRHDDLVIDERHLGLIPSNESRIADAKIQTIAQHVSDQVDLAALTGFAKQTRLDLPSISTLKPASGKPVRIGIARDAAFGFYYPGDLAALEQAGASLVPFSPLEDDKLPTVDGVFIGGGFPETHLAALENNRSLRADLREKIENNLPVYAECGGLMYLARSIEWQGQCHDMVGTIPGRITMHEKPQGRGYIRLKELPGAPWPPAPGQEEADELYAHEFHYSRLDDLEHDKIRFVYQVLRGTGVDGKHDGIVYKNVLANYAHLRNVDAHPWAARFVEFVRQHQTIGIDQAARANP